MKFIIINYRLNDYSVQFIQRFIQASITSHIYNTFRKFYVRNLNQGINNIYRYKFTIFCGNLQYRIDAIAKMGGGKKKNKIKNGKSRQNSRRWDKRGSGNVYSVLNSATVIL